MLPPRRIAMSGGAMKGIAHVGALEVLQERGYLRHVIEYIGTSAGALMALCLCIGYTVAELRELCTRFDFTLLQTLEPDSMLNVLETYGLDTGENLDKLLRALLKMRGYGPDATFSDISGALRVYTTDLHTCEIREFSRRATPIVPVRIAVAASMAIPLYFTPVRDPATGNFLVDGGLIAHFPFHHLTNEERSETLGIAYDQNFKVKDEDGIGSFVEFFLQLYYSVYHHQNERLFSKWKHRIIFIPCGEFPSMKFDSTSDQKEGLIASGRRGAEEFLAAGCSTGAPPARRHSV